MIIIKNKQKTKKYGHKEEVWKIINEKKMWFLQSTQVIQRN